MRVSQAEMHSEKREELEQRKLERTGCISNMGNRGEHGEK